MKAEEGKHLDELDQENGRLKKLVVGLSLDVQMLKEIAWETSEAFTEADGCVASRVGVRVE